MVRVRFAPSPTGYLHIGNVRTALFNYLYAKHEGGKFILRIENTDTQRSKPEYERSLEEDLRWLGLDWDEGPFRQSERTQFYNDALEKLKRGGHVYRCFCTTETLEAKRQTAQKEKRPPRYDGTCRNLTEAEVNQKLKAGIPFSYRFKIQNPKVEFTDLIKGPISVNLDDMVGDFVVARQDGSPLFHLTVCVDDVEMKITHVIRGEDHLSNTPRHILIFKALGASLPQFAHMPLILGEDGQPLSKRLGDFSVREFRAKGYPPDGVINYLALLGWSPGDDSEFMYRERLIGLFTIKRVVSSPARFNREKFEWLLHRHFQEIKESDLVSGMRSFIQSIPSGDWDYYLTTYGQEGVSKRLTYLQHTAYSFDSLAHHFEVNFGRKIFDEYDKAQKFMSEPGFMQVLQVLKDCLCSPKNENYFLEDVKVYVEALKHLNLKGEKLYKPIRLLLTGALHGPELKELLPMIPKHSAVERIEKIEKALKKAPI